ncbi:MAG TPA: hypothetical protein VL400_06260, partial [Polyangiaceae bacterium]|nr:hypothetical protein [Polyangiaceae bacterium]
RMAARAPRLVTVAVERVTRLAAAAIAFAKKSPAAYAAFAAAPDDLKGKPAVLSGEIVDLRTGPASVTVLVRPDVPECKDKPCLARATIGRPDADLARGDVVRFFGTLNGAVEDGAAKPPAGAQAARVPDLSVAFFLRDKRAADAGRPDPGAPGRKLEW